MLTILVSMNGEHVSPDHHKEDSHDYFHGLSPMYCSNCKRREQNIEKVDDKDDKLHTVMKSILVEDPITLDDILNIWDGIRETPGRILIISSNHYNKLDPALTRPGRIDIAMEMSHASRQTIVEMYEHFFKCSIDPNELNLIPDKKYTPAEVMNMYIRSSFSPEQFLKLLSQR